MRWVLVALMLASGSLAAPATAATVGFDLSAGNTFSPGQTITLTLDGSGFTQPVDGGGVTLQYNPAVLQVESVSVNTGVWDFAPSNGATDNTNGAVSDILFNALLNPSPSGTFSIATVQFLAQSAGSSTLLLSESAANPFSSGGVALVPGTDFTFQDSTVTVSPVPLPSSVWLLGTAVLILAGAAAFATRERDRQTHHVGIPA